MYNVEVCYSNFQDNKLLFFWIMSSSFFSNFKKKAAKIKKQKQKQKQKKQKQEDNRN